MMWFIIISLIILLGCGTVEKAADSLSAIEYKILPKKEEPKKKVLVIPFLCAWNTESDFGIKVSERFAKRLKKIPGNLLVYKPKNPHAWKFLGPVPELGIINDPEMIEDARNIGMNYLVTGIIDVMKVAERTNGIWPFRHYDNIFEAVMIINVFDTITGALIESHMESEEFSIPVNKTPKKREEIFRKVIKNTLPGLIRKQTRLCAGLIMKDQWKSRIIEVEENPGKLKIEGGKDVGIKEGMEMDVFEWGKRIIPSSSPPFYFLGKRIGRIRIISVKDNYSIAVPLKRADYRPDLPVVFSD